MVSLSSLSQVAVEHAMAVYANEYSTPDIDESVLQHMSEDEIRTVTLARQLDAHNTGLKQVQTPARARAPMDEAPMDETPMRLRLRLHAVCMLCALQRPSSSTSRRASWCRTSCTAEPRKPMRRKAWASASSLPSCTALGTLSLSRKPPFRAFQA